MVDDVPHHEMGDLLVAEIYDALVTGTRPVYFQETPESFIWGSGSLFIAAWKGEQFAITAKHVFTNAKADPKHTRLFFAGYKVALPIAGVSTPSFPNHASREDVEDIAVLRLQTDADLDGEALAWHSWRMDVFWRSAEDLVVGQSLYAAGFPSNDDRFDYDNNKLNEVPLVSVGKLGEDSLGPGLFCMDTAEFDRSIAGSSGGPVFARFGGFFHYVGMIIRGGSEARKIHFLDAKFVTFTLDQAARAVQSSKADQ